MRARNVGSVVTLKYYDKNGIGRLVDTFELKILYRMLDKYVWSEATYWNIDGLNWTWHTKLALYNLHGFMDSEIWE